MSQIVHITFEKLTGLKGEIEGLVLCDYPDRIDARLPIIFVGFIKTIDGKHKLIFSQMGEMFYLSPILINSFDNYKEHFKYGTNFLIKSWSHGGGVTINSQPPN